MWVKQDVVSRVDTVFELKQDVVGRVDTEQNQLTFLIELGF
jgi:hypothetical protein